MKLAVLFLSALIVSTCAHDHLKSRQHQHSKHSHLRNRDNSEEKSNQTESNNGHLCVSYNATTSIQIVYNQTGEAGAVVDSKSFIVVIFSDNTRVAFAVYLKLNISVQLRSDNLNGNWGDYLSNQSSLTEIVNSRKESSFNVTSPPSDISKEIRSILSKLNSQDCKLSTFIWDVDIITTTTRRFSNNIPSYKTNIRGDFAKVAKRFECISTLLNRSNVSGNSSVSLDLGSLLNQSSGIDFLKGIFDRLPETDIQKALGGSLQSRERFLSFLGQYDTFSRAISSIIAAGNGNSSTQNLITSLLEYYRNPSPDDDQSWTASIQNLLGTIGRFNSNGTPNLQNFDLLNILSGIPNSSNILDALRNRDQDGGLFNIVHILGGLSSEVPANESLPNLFGQVISLYRAFPPPSPSPLSNIISSTSSSRFGSLSNVINDFISLFMKAIQTGIHVAEFFMSLPLRFFVGPFIAAVSEFFKGLNFSDLFRSRNAVEFFIKGLETFIRIPFSYGAAMFTGFANVFGAGVEVGAEIVQGFQQAAGGGSNNASVGAQGSSSSQISLPIIGGLSREHAHGKHSHKERHHSGEGKKHGNKERRHDTIQKRHEIQHKKREIKEKKTGFREKRGDTRIKQNKHEIHHN